MEAKTVEVVKPGWSARCCCYNGHASASGRCTDRGPRGEGISDPTRSGYSAVCETCRKECPCGDGPVKQPAPLAEVRRA